MRVQRWLRQWERVCLCVRERNIVYGGNLRVCEYELSWVCLSRCSQQLKIKLQLRKQKQNEMILCRCRKIKGRNKEPIMSVRERWMRSKLLRLGKNEFVLENLGKDFDVLVCGCDCLLLMRKRLCKWVCVCVCEREREREKERKKKVYKNVVKERETKGKRAST